MRNVEIDINNKEAANAAALFYSSCSNIAYFLGTLFSKKLFPHTTKIYQFDDEGISFVTTVLDLAEQGDTIFAKDIIDEMIKGKNGLDKILTEYFYDLLLSEKLKFLSVTQNYFSTCYPEIMKDKEITLGTEITKEEVKVKVQKELEKRR